MPGSSSIFSTSPINMELFFTLSDNEILRQIYSQFSHELDRLRRAYSITDKNIIRPPTESPSQILYGAQYDEVNRTLVSVLSLRWIRNDRYEAFTGAQPSPVVLAPASFRWIHDIFMKELNTPMDLYALLTCVIINDLGKDPQLASDYYAIVEEDISSMNHDFLLLRAIDAGLVPCMDRLPPVYRDKVMRGIQLGAEFNFGQLAQAENAPACLYAVKNMRGHEQAFKFHFLEQILDVSGAAGHEDWTCAKKFIQPIFEAYQNVYKVTLGIISGEYGLREGYDVILSCRGRMLFEKEFQTLDVRNDEDRALLRLFCMGGVSSLETARLYNSVWASLDRGTKNTLVRSLNVDGSIKEPAVQPTYMPAMLAQGLGEVGLTSHNDQARRLQSLLRYLARVMTLTNEPDGQAMVVERSLLWIVKDIIQGDEFRKNPDILESTEVPQSIIAMST